MQIHELTQLKEASIADRIKSVGTAVKTGVQNMQDKIATSNVAAGQAQQDKTQAQAAQYAEKLRKQGYTGQPAAAPTSAVQPGQRVLVTAIQPNGTKTNYYKTNQGWENELGQPVTNPTSVAYLEKLYASQARPGASSAGAVQTTSAGAVQTGGAQAVMTSGDFNSALTQLNMNTTQIAGLKQKITQDPSFANVFLRALGLKR